MKTLFETYLQLTGYNISHYSNELKRIRSLSPDEFREWQDSKKWEIARHHYINNPFYKEKIGKHFPDKWEDLPVMEKSDYQDDLENLLSKGYNRKNTYVANTSGSSGHPFYFAKNKEAHAISWALIKNRYSWHGLDLNSKQARFFGIPLETTTKSQEKIKDWIINRVRFPIFDLSDSVLQSFIGKFNRTKFDYIYGYTNSLVLFARFLIRINVVLKDICPTLRVCITTAETATKEDREILTKAFGVNILNEYGVSEVSGLVAYEDTHSNWRLTPETQYFEILDDNNLLIIDKNEGNIVLTDLHNKAMPFVRYRVGDIGILAENIIEGKYLILKELLGRTNDNIILPSGKISPGLTFYYISRSILESTGILREFIIRQTHIDTFILDVVTDRKLSEQEFNEIKNQMDLYLEPGLSLKINRVPKINRPSSGKIKHFYSEIE